MSNNFKQLFFRAYIGPGVYSQGQLPRVRKSSRRTEAANHAANGSNSLLVLAIPRVSYFKYSLLCKAGFAGVLPAPRLVQWHYSLRPGLPSCSGYLRPVWWAEVGAGASLPRDKLRGFFTWGLIVTRAPLAAPSKETDLKRKRREISCLKLNHEATLQDRIPYFSV